MSAKKREKVQPLGHFFGLALEKNYDFAWFGRKIKINRDLVEMLRNFIDTSIKIYIDDVQSFVTFRISVDFFIFSIAIFFIYRHLYMYFYRGVCKVS